MWGSAGNNTSHFRSTRIGPAIRIALPLVLVLGIRIALALGLVPTIRIALAGNLQLWNSPSEPVFRRIPVNKVYQGSDLALLYECYGLELDIVGYLVC